jgi:hypothetical protein
MTLTAMEAMRAGLDGNQLARTLTDDVRARALGRTANQVLRALACLVNPRTGWTRLVSDQEIADVLLCSPDTVRRARRVLLSAGVVRAYRPGSGRTPSRYALVRSWDDARPGLPAEGTGPGEGTTRGEAGNR